MAEASLLDDEMESNYELNTVEETEFDDMLEGAEIIGDLPSEITGSQSVGAPSESGNSVVLPDASMRFKDAKAKVLDAFERRYLQDLLQRHELNISKAAREAGIDRRHLYRLLEKYSIEIKERTVE